MLFADFPNSKFWFPEFVSSYAWLVTLVLQDKCNNEIYSPACALTLYLLVTSADKLCKQFGPRSAFVGPDLDRNCLTL